MSIGCLRFNNIEKPTCIICWNSESEKLFDVLLEFIYLIICLSVLKNIIGQKSSWWFMSSVRPFERGLKQEMSHLIGGQYFTLLQVSLSPTTHPEFIFFYSKLLLGNLCWKSFSQGLP